MKKNNNKNKSQYNNLFFFIIIFVNKNSNKRFVATKQTTACLTHIHMYLTQGKQILGKFLYKQETKQRKERDRGTERVSVCIILTFVEVNFSARIATQNQHSSSLPFVTVQLFLSFFLIYTWLIGLAFFRVGY